MAYNPILADGAGYSTRWACEQFLPTQCQGPFSNGSDKYIIAADVTFSTAVITWQAYKSTDSGQTWAALDSAHASTLGHTVGSRYFWNANAFYSGSGTVIYTAFVNSSNVLTVQSFDMSTDTWGTASTGGPTSANFISNQSLGLVHTTDGHTVVVYTSTTDPFNGHYSVYNGSTWNVSDHLIPTVASWALANPIIVNGNIVAILFFDSSFWVFYTYNASTNTLSAGQVAFSNSNYEENSIGGLYRSSDDTWNYALVQASNSLLTLVHAHGTPSSSGTPTWTLDTVYTHSTTGLSGYRLQGPFLVISSDGTTLYMLVCERVSGANFFNNVQLFTKVGSGSWSGPTLFYNMDSNAAAQPPTDGAWNQHSIDGVSAVYIGGSSLLDAFIMVRFTVAANVIPGVVNPQPFETVYYLASAAVAKNYVF